MSMSTNSNLLWAAIISVTCLLGACGGGGGPAPAPRPPAPAPAPQPQPQPEPEPEPPAPPLPPAPPPPPNFDTIEYRQNYGLGAINAISAYDDGLSGDGITVAVIDSGYHADFTDLSGNISPNSTDIIAGRNDLGGGSDHGTAVSAVIAAEKNNLDIHGVAYEAEILSIRTDSPDACDDDGCGFFDNDIASAVDYAVANGADIINLSIAGNAPNNETLNTALDAAMDAGLIVILASGNENMDIPLASTLYALTDGANGQAIIVGATDENDDIWFSPGTGEDPDSGTNKAGALAQDVFLVAPGVDIVFTCGVAFCSAGTGTSLAAPHVAGAVALLLEKFPNLTAAEVVQIVLTTAADLGATGPDAVYGMGLVDLAAAIAPIGQLSMTTSNGTTVPVGQGSIQVGAAFGDAFTTSPRAHASLGNVLATDFYDRTYAVNLGAMLTIRPNARFDLSQRARSRIYGRHHSIAAPGIGLIEIGYTQRWGALAEEDLFANLNRDNTTKPLDVSFNLYRPLNKNLALSLHHGAALEDKFLGYQHGATLFATGDAFMQFASDGTGASLHQMLDQRTQLSIVGSFADYRALHNGPALTRSMGAIQLDHLASENMALSVRVGTINENGSVLNMVAYGAYDVFDKATTVFATFNARYDLANWSFSLSASFGITDTGNRSSVLLSDVSDFQSTAYSVAARWQTSIPGHYLSFGISQPLRVENGSVLVNAPTSRDLNTEIFSFTSSELSLSPSAREIDLEIGHLFQGQNGVSLSTNLVYRMNPGHSALGHDAIAFLSHVQFAF
jgi:subtilisin family serine protease